MFPSSPCDRTVPLILWMLHTLRSSASAEESLIWFRQIRGPDAWRHQLQVWPKEITILLQTWKTLMAFICWSTVMSCLIWVNCFVSVSVSQLWKKYNIQTFLLAVRPAIYWFLRNFSKPLFLSQWYKITAR